MAAMAEAILMVRGGPDDGSSITLSEKVTIGRVATNDIVVDEEGVSRRHALIRGGPDGYWISDMGSRNGTFVNRKRLGVEPRQLRNFDRIEIGGAKATVRWDFLESQSTTTLPSPSSQ